ncbi:MAG TPA: diadenylate cyclase CdaA [Desulfobacteria bacterium]|nr:diadenylate cyclase CdaA [Desulfobacteria bacterium]
MLAQLPTISLINIIDMLVVAVLIYKLFQLIRETRAVQLLKGLVVLLVAATVSDWLHLYTINWILENVRTMVVVAIPVVFQPELRRTLERLGRGKLFGRPQVILGDEDTLRIINEIVRSMVTMAKNKIGALIVIERETGITDYIETGVALDGIVSGELLTNLFIPNSPLHDGAVIIRGDRVAAAGCFLPLSDSPGLSQELGTRHRAAIGVSELSDVVALVVSEETGIISIAYEGKLTRYLDERTTREFLEEKLYQKPGVQGSFWNWRS